MPRGYFRKNVPELKMPRPEEWPAEAGFRAQGEVMAGKTPVMDAHRKAEARVAQAQLEEFIRSGRTGKCWATPEEYDPVLRFHCRMSR